MDCVKRHKSNGLIAPNPMATLAAALGLMAYFKNAPFPALQASTNAVPVNIDWVPDKVKDKLPDPSIVVPQGENRIARRHKTVKPVTFYVKGPRLSPTEPGKGKRKR